MGERPGDAEKVTEALRLLDDHAHCPHLVGHVPCQNRDPQPHTHHAAVAWAADVKHDDDGADDR